ncbi:MAG: hypothetical protein AB7O73_02140 [Bacteroidia bacterium]
MKHLLIIIFSLLFSTIYSQKVVVKSGHRAHRHPHKRHRSKVVVVKLSKYRPAKVVVFHPVWRPKWAYHRRWVFWPKYNLYWDNWRNHYLFWNGTMWISQTAVPPVVVNVNLAEEKHKELKEDEDDTDDIYKDNDSHKKD